MRRHERSGRTRPAFVAMDTLLSIVVIVALLMTVTVAMVKQARASRELAASRAAMRTCEEMMARLQTRGAATAEGVQVQNLDDAAPAGSRWVRITATQSGHRATLTGLTPGGAP